jgi:hypothetical protein
MRKKEACASGAHSERVLLERTQPMRVLPTAIHSVTIVDAFRALGFALVDADTRHFTVVKENRRVTVPRRTILDQTAIRELLRSAGVLENTFIDCLANRAVAAQHRPRARRQA